jgi:hypothetical protein
VTVVVHPSEVRELRRYSRWHVGGVRFVPVGMGAAPGGVRGVVGVLEVERSGDPVPDQVGQARPGDPLQDGANGGVVGVAVGEFRAWREQRIVLHSHGEQLRRRPPPPVFAEDRRQERGIVGVVEQAGGVVQQHAQRDRLAARHLARQPLLHRIGQGELALGDELQYERGDHGLGVGSHPELVPHPEQVIRSGPGSLLGDLDRPAAAVVDPCDHAGRPGVHQLPRQLVQLGGLRLSAAPGRGRRGRGGGRGVGRRGDRSGGRIGGRVSWPVECDGQAGHGQEGRRHDEAATVSAVSGSCSGLFLRAREVCCSCHAEHRSAAALPGHRSAPDSWGWGRPHRGGCGRVAVRP